MQYLVRSKPLKLRSRGRATNVAHLWDGHDTLCTMWSTGGLKKSSYLVAADPGTARICTMCGEQAAGHVGRAMRQAAEADRVNELALS